MEFEKQVSDGAFMSTTIDPVRASIAELESLAELLD